MLISVKNLNKFFGERCVLKDISFTVEDGGRYGLIGVNGAGKTTLLNVLCGELHYESGDIFKTSGLSIGYLRQNNGLEAGSTINEEMHKPFSDVLRTEEKMRALETELSKNPKNSERLLADYNRLQAYMDSRDGYNTDVKINTVLSGMGFGDRDRETVINTLSGGEKTRLAIAKLLLEEPQLLILDEPTNHLDFKTLSWLEDYLLSYKGAILIISHDRYFLDKTVDEILELERGKLISYKGNYSKYLVLKKERLARLNKEYEMQQAKIADMQEYIDKNIVRASTSKSAKSRVKALESMDIIEKPEGDLRQMKLSFKTLTEPYKDVLKTENLTVAVGDGAEKKLLTKNLNLDIKRGEKIAIIGENGIGKSSFLKTVLGIIPPEEGEVIWGKNTTVSYYEQENLNLNFEKRAIDELWDRFPDIPEAEIRRTLGNVLLTQEEVFKPVKILSGGERAKLAFCIIMLEKSNVILFDEPTNHLDLASKEILEAAMNDYGGTLVFVSHDRYLLNKVPDKIIELKEHGADIYDGGFDFYMEKITQKAAEAAEKKRAEKTAEAEKTKFVHGYKTKEQRRADANRKNRIRELEALISENEEKVSQIENDITLPEVFSNYEIMQKKCSELEKTKNLLDEYYNEWAELS